MRSYIINVHISRNFSSYPRNGIPMDVSFLALAHPVMKFTIMFKVRRKIIPMVSYDARLLLYCTVVVNGIIKFILLNIFNSAFLAMQQTMVCLESCTQCILKEHKNIVLTILQCHHSNWITKWTYSYYSSCCYSNGVVVTGM